LRTAADLGRAGGSIKQLSWCWQTVSVTYESPTNGLTRVTVPLTNRYIDSEEGHWSITEPKRFNITKDVVFAQVTSSERERLKGYGHENVCCRLEIFDVLADFNPWGNDPHQHTGPAIDRVNHVLGLLSLVVRFSFSGYLANLDRYDGDQWRREWPLWTEWTDGRHQGFVGIPEDRLVTWGKLLDNWPANPDPRLTLALRYYLESIRDREDRNYPRAMIAAGIATEVLFGDTEPELSYRIGLRAAHLVARSEGAILVQQAIRRLYRGRSKAVHRGAAADLADVALWQQFLMRAIPSVAAFQNDVGTLGQLNPDLSAANFVRSGALDKLLDAEDGWWRFCDFPALLS